MIFEYRQSKHISQIRKSKL